MRKNLILLIAVSLIVLPLACKKGDQQSAENAKALKEISADQISAAEVSSGEQPRKSEAAANPQTEILPDHTAKLIKKAQAEIEVDELAASAAVIVKKTAASGGYVQSSEISGSEAQITVRIPGTQFEQYLDSCKSGGKLISLTSGAEDVSLQYFDLEGRIRAKRILQERIAGYLKNASSVKDLLVIEAELNRVTEELESVESQFRGMKDSITYATVVIRLTLPAYKGYIAELPSLKGGFYSFVNVMAHFFYGLFFAMLYLGAIGGVLILIIAVLLYVTVGRLGLVLRLYRKVMHTGKHS
jgi:hypothetical protein